MFSSKKIYAFETINGKTIETTTIYKDTSIDSEKIYKIKKNNKTKIIDENKDWYLIKFEENEKLYKGWISKKNVITGEDIINYAKKFIGNPYEYGGESLTEGTDCSGFVKSIYKKFGYSLPHSSDSLRTEGIKVSSLEKAVKGDIICYDGHVAIYIGNNKIIHASSEKTGIKIGTNAKYKKILSIRRII